MAVIAVRYNKRAANCRKPPHATTTKARGMLAQGKLYPGGLEGRRQQSCIPGGR